MSNLWMNGIRIKVEEDGETGILFEEEPTTGNRIFRLLLYHNW